MKLEIYRNNKLISSKDCGDFEINLSQLPYIKKEKIGNTLKVYIKWVITAF